ncbi:MAG: FliH/SctL family protein [Planctomycetota bacterium]|jgi:flagellar biosynthesis/type III secretory pathway protein FliH
MSQTVTIQFEKAIDSAKLLNGAAGDVTTASAEAKQTELPGLQKEGLAQVCQALQDAVNKVNEFQEKLLKEHKEEIAKLSVEIARKILVQKIQEKDYSIEPIIEEALKNAPTRQDVVVHLNPEDLVEYQKVPQDDPASSRTLADVKFVSDPHIGRAECLLETPKGIIESLIEERLERISKALETAE